MANFCGYCGSALKAGSKFCGSCGNQISTEQPLQQPIEQYQQPIQQYETPISQQCQKSVEQQGSSKKSRRRIRFIIPAVILVVGLITAIFFLFIKNPSAPVTGKLAGEPVSGRAVTINAENFGYYHEDCLVTVNKEPAGILSWTKQQIYILLPPDISGDITIEVINNKENLNITVKDQIKKRKNTLLAEIQIEPDKEGNYQENGASLIYPAGAVKTKQSIVVQKYQEAIPDERLYVSDVIAEYDVSCEDGDHLLFERPVLLGFQIDGMKAENSYMIQYYEEAVGAWVNIDTIPDIEAGVVYTMTNHLTPYRVTENSCRQEGEGVTNGNITSTNYTKEKAGLFWRYTKVSDDIGNYVVWYLNSDSENDKSIETTAEKVLSSMNKAHERYRQLFGEAVMPTTVLAFDTPNLPSGMLSGRINQIKESIVNGEYLSVEEARVKQDESFFGPVNVYIEADRYASEGLYWPMNNSIYVPASYSETDSIEQICGHELFHAVQLQSMRSYFFAATNGLTEYVRGKSETAASLIPSGKWFIEATAQYAGDFVATDAKLDSPIPSTLVPSINYFTADEGQEYAMEFFLDYIINRKLNYQDRGEGFKYLYQSVISDISVVNSCTRAFEDFIDNQTKRTAKWVYREFIENSYTKNNERRLSENNNAKKVVDDMIIKYVSPLSTSGSNTMNISLDTHACAVASIVMDVPGAINNKKAAYQPGYDQIRSLWVSTNKSDKELTAPCLYRLEGVNLNNRSDDPIPVGITEQSGKPIGEIGISMIPFTQSDCFHAILIAENATKKKMNVSFQTHLTEIKIDSVDDLLKSIQRQTVTAGEKMNFSFQGPQLLEGDGYTVYVEVASENSVTTEKTGVETGEQISVPLLAEGTDYLGDSVEINIKVYAYGTLVHHTVITCDSEVTPTPTKTPTAIPTEELTPTEDLTPTENPQTPTPTEEPTATPSPVPEKYAWVLVSEGIDEDDKFVNGYRRIEGTGRYTDYTFTRNEYTSTMTDVYECFCGECHTFCQICTYDAPPDRLEAGEILTIHVTAQGEEAKCPYSLSEDVWFTPYCHGYLFTSEYESFSELTDAYHGITSASADYSTEIPDGRDFRGTDAPQIEITYSLDVSGWNYIFVYEWTKVE